MALSAARSRNTHVLMVPSMHADLANDPVTDDIVERLREEGIDVMWGDLEEGKRKTPNHEHIVARLLMESIQLQRIEERRHHTWRDIFAY